MKIRVIFQPEVIAAYRVAARKAAELTRAEKR